MHRGSTFSDKAFALMLALFAPAVLFILAIHWDGQRVTFDDERAHYSSVELK